MSLRKRTILLLKKYSITPRKELGQSFLVNEKVAEYIVDTAKVDDLTVLEIGAGLGALTELLALKARKVYAIEVDPLLCKILREEILKNRNNVIIMEADFLSLEPPPVDVVVSNIPYSIASPILFKLARECIFSRAILTLQKELALRITSKPGTKEYGRLTVSLNAFFKPTLLTIIRRKNFYPEPEVDSALIKLERYRPPYEIDDLDLHLDIVRALFTQRNKTLRRALEISLKKILNLRVNNTIFLDKRLEKYMSLRVRNLQSSDLANISNVIKEYIEK
ncbi:MAG: 16S rRNA (adenine(1518)-N(6)/adenine(1519)-N(6))-dimethyltransferase RsmA [Candidatus Nezhaarchaeota archaeon]|nr:16S rRNA (adenine(1518)-N(6)/adenine(1519)-N(6))-dimethyltransferase RsmA [Candidatus Nezhaarchaeota archaeon]MCX8141869.1 16S rRNA (adenine(1518)-N(6)/adenine(1519)-N(6))-dimethyltransferase RsmA [Candidatus Nezhaarchaeota archaeon]MDW8050350.1 16S rRNA (adenine(1518)-N(6)/adenine(1519)-N(6))-dimethyltransferase RsmA [Nitrososphaerota archaeon]